MARKPKSNGPEEAAGKLFIVGGDKGGVGKTTVARLLVEYFDEMRRPARAFDTEFPKGSLVRFHPKTTRVLDITTVKGQIEVFDSLRESRSPHVLDLRAGTFSNVLRTFEDIAILDQLREGLIEIHFLHVIGGNYEALGEVADAMEQLPIDRHIVVKSHATDPDFVFWTESDIRARFLRGGGTEIAIPRLDELVYETVDTNSAPFRAFIQNKTADGQPANYSLVLRGYCRKWLADIFAEFANLAPLKRALEAPDQ
jgi:hypothetical protein